MTEKRRFFHSLIFPCFFLFIIWIIKLFEYFFDLDLSVYGIFPLKIKGLLGIITSPLIHGDFNHLIANSIPILVLSTGIFYFYRNIAYKVFFLIYLIAGIWIWLSARQAYHIGCSGLIYGFASFLFFSGILSKDRKLMAISLLTIFLYGGLIWGIFPLKKNISWESHLLGMIAGIVLAFYYKNYKPGQELSKTIDISGEANQDITFDNIDIYYHFSEDITEEEQ
ncbi:MAG: rhomboid family intramembrane serine protease [Bacteroidales bacterium]|nr:rhomboid family intramembrane serine protease [Bacteroidales bacterium]